MPSSRFNSKLVRLKGIHSIQNILAFVTMFQFQTGSIKSLAPILHLYYSILSFNSKLVRLKARMPTNTRKHYIRFNSKLVRLKVKIALTIGACIMFQFQTGSIKSYQNLNPTHPMRGFNSKLVRLKGS